MDGYGGGYRQTTKTGEGLKKGGKMKKKDGMGSGYGAHDMKGDMKDMKGEKKGHEYGKKYKGKM